MKTPSLDRRITIQELTVTRGAAGGVVESYATVATIWAQKIEQSASEFRSASAVHTSQIRLFRARYRSDITTKHRVVYGGKNHDILEVTEEGRSDLMIIVCKYTEGRS